GIAWLARDEQVVAGCHAVEGEEAGLARRRLERHRREGPGSGRRRRAALEADALEPDARVTERFVPLRSNDEAHDARAGPQVERPRTEGLRGVDARAPAVVADESAGPQA